MGARTIRDAEGEDDRRGREAELKSVLGSELLSRKFSYTCSDDSAWTLVLKDVGDFEMAYHLDDGVEPVGRAS